MAFHDINFPLRLAFGASGGPTRAVDIVTLASGREARNTAQSRARRRYNAMTGVKSVDDARKLSDFFEARSGALHSFRFHDPVDHSSGSDVPIINDQIIGTGDGETRSFQLVKRYGDVVRPILLPLPDSVTVAVNGVPVPFTLLSRGQIDIDAPALGASVTAGFLFDVPVRFDTDSLSLSLDRHGAVSVTDVPLIEVFDHA